MGNKVYYGEYSLDHWIKLILKKNIVLPDYQRNFTWTLKTRKNLIKSLKEKEFVPPVTIGFFSENGKNENLIIDGQQRLTSILLSVIGYFPDRDAYKKYIDQKKKSEREDIIKFLDGNDDIEEIKENLDEPDVIDWSFSDLLEQDKDLTVEQLRKKIKNIKYFKPLDNGDEKIDKNFLQNTYLGFSYLVPKKGGQQDYYSSVFRNINMQGMKLSFQESRKALYYLNKDKEAFFMPNFIKLMKGEYRMDFVRYISILSQYEKHRDATELCKGYGGRKDKIEEFYEEYIDVIINNRESNDFYSYKELFGNDGHEDRLSKLEKIIKDSKLYLKEFESIIDCDMYYFGLIYMILFKKKDISLDNWSNLEECLNKQINIYRARYIDENGEPTSDYLKIKYESLHYRNPSALKYLRERVSKSIEIYQKVIG